MKKTILATTILSMISFGTLAQQVNVVEANKQTNALIENQISAIDASVLAQLEAQESSVAVVDGNLYQKDSEGGWAMVGATSAALVAGLFSGSSSNTSSSNGSDLPGNLPNIDAVNPVENTPANPIEATPDADNGRQVDQIADNMWQVSTHGEVDGYLSIENGTVYVRDSDHNLVTEWKPTLGHPIQIDPTNPIEATPDADNGRQVDQIADNMWQVSTHGEVDGYLSIENGTVYVRDSDHNLVTEWKPTLGHPIQIDPTNPIEATPDADNGRQVDQIADNMWQVSTHGEVDGYLSIENGTVYVRDSDHNLVTEWKPTLGHPIQIDPTNPIEATPDADNGRQVDQIADNMWQVSTHGEVDGYLSIENGTVYVRDSDHNLVTEWKPTLGHPIQIDPTNPIEATPDADNGRQVDQIADNMWQVSTHGEVDGYLSIENGTVYVRDSDHNLVTEWKPTLGHPIQIDPTNPIEATPDADNGRQVDQIADNMWQISTHGEVDGYLSIENGTVYVRDSDHNLVTEWKPTLGHPIQIDPTNPIEATPDADNGRQSAKVGDNVWMITTHDAIDGYVIDERHHNDGVKVYDENGKLVNHITGDISTDGGYIESTKGGEIHITVDRESGRIDGIYLNDVAQQTVDNIKSHIGSNPNFKKNIQQLKNRVMNARG